jgi:hypothetical protein
MPKWLAGAIVLLSVVYSVFTGIRDFGLIISLFAGLVVGLLVAALLALLVKLGHAFRGKYPRLARWIGNAVLWVVGAMALYVAGIAMIVAYNGGSIELVGKLVAGVAVWAALALGLRYVLKPPPSLKV